MKTFFCLILLSVAIPSLAHAEEKRWYVLLSDQYFQCAGFWSASGDVLEKRFLELSDKAKQASIDAAARGIISFKREFPKASGSDFLALHLQLHLDKYKEIWLKELKHTDYQTVASQLESCQELSSDILGDLKAEDFIPSLGI